MKNFFPTTVLMLIGILTATFSANAQLYEVSLDEKIQQSSLIVEGRVVAQESYRTPEGEVYTANKVAVGALLKGKLKENFVTVTTWGGVTEDGAITWTHMLALQPGEEGIFFLERTRAPETSNKDFPSPSFDAYSSSQGFLKFARNDNGAWVAYEPFHTYTNLKDDIFDCIAGKTGHPHVVTDASRSVLHRSGIRYFFKATSVSGNTVNFEILVNSLYDNKQLHKAGAALNYNPVFFGPNIATSGNLQLQANGISANSVYSLTKSNLTSSKAKIELSTIGSVSSLSTLTTTEQTLAKGSLTIENPLVDPGISFGVDEMYALSKFWENGSSYEFDTIVVETDFRIGFFCNPPVITSFSPATLRAGTDDTLTIRGTCFDNVRGSSEVEFTDSKAGPMPVTWVQPLDGEYIVWSDTLIRVIVPSIVKGMDISQSASTGRFRVNKGAGGIATSSTDLTILFAALNFGTGQFSKPKNKGIPISLSNYNTLGGQSIYYASNFKADTNAVKAFERALINWKCITFVNYKVQDSTDVPNIARAGRIEYASLPTGVTTTLASTDNIPYTPCIAVDSVVRANRRSFVIKFNSNLSWHTDTLMPTPLPANTFDLESRAVHELGHAHLLNHSNNPTDLMYFTDLTPPYRRVIEPNDAAGGIYIMSISTPAAPTGCQTQMTALTPANCGITSVLEKDNGFQLNIDIYPNPASNELNIIVHDQAFPWFQNEIQASLFDLLGRKIKAIRLADSATVLPLDEVSPGLYILTLSYEGQQVQSFKIQKQ